MLGSTIQRELMEIIMRDLNDPRLMGFPSITRVKVSSDLSIADVYVTVMGTPGQQNAALELKGDVKLVASDGFELTTGAGTFNRDTGVARNLSK